MVAYFFFGLDFLKLLATSKYGFTQIDIYICATCTVITSIAVYIDTQSSIPLELEKITTGSNIGVLIIVFVCFLSTHPMFWIPWAVIVINDR